MRMLITVIRFIVAAYFAVAGATCVWGALQGRSLSFAFCALIFFFAAAMLALLGMSNKPNRKE